MASRTIRLCAVDSVRIEFSIKGKMPMFSLDSCFARLRTGEGVEIYRYDSFFGIDPLNPMVNIDARVSYLMNPFELDLEFEVVIPQSASTEESDLTYEILSPSFQVFNGDACIETAEPPAFSIPEFDIFDTHYQLFGARLIETLYVDFPATQNLLESIVPLGTKVVGVAAAGPWQTGIIACQVGDMLLLGKVGTQTPGQIVTQGLQYMRGPIKFNGVGTIPMWREAAIACTNLLGNFDLNTVKRMTLIGYSLGGSTVCVLAAWLLLAGRDLDIRILTFGRPKPGDFALASFLNDRVRIVGLENAGDPVPYFPPRERQVPLFAITVVSAALQSDAFLDNMNAFYHPKGRLTLFDDGSTLEGDPLETDPTLVGEYLVDWIANDPGPVFALHFMSSYLLFLERRIQGQF